MTTPPYLKPGDKVGVISTAKRTEPHEIEAGLSILKSWELVPVVGANAFKQDGFLAGTDTERLADLQQMLDDVSIKAVFFSKGGYGTMRIIDDIDWTQFKKHPKWIVGYSDITLLHCHIHNFGIETLHAVMLQGMASGSPEAVASIKTALFGESLHYTIPYLAENTLGYETIEGVLTGGNLSILYAVVGSESDVDMEGKILFIEDIDEYLYHYDRMLVSLKRAGKLAKLKAVLIGSMVDIKDSTLPYGRTDKEITLQHFDCPVVFGIPAGHVKDNLSLIMGRSITISRNGDDLKLRFS